MKLMKHKKRYIMVRKIMVKIIYPFIYIKRSITKRGVL